MRGSVRFRGGEALPTHTGALPAGRGALSLGLGMLLVGLSIGAGAALAGDVGSDIFAPSRSDSVWASPPPDSAAAVAAPTTLAEYLTVAALENAGLRAAFASWQAAGEKTRHAGAYPDPRLSFAYYIRQVETRVGPQQAQLGLSQTLPWFGKLGLQEDVAVEAAEAARRRYESVKLRLFYEVKDAYHEYDYLRSAIDITRRNLELLVDLEEVARIRYRTAATEQADLIKAQVEMGRLEDRLSALENLRAPAMARLNALMNRPVDTPLPWPGGEVVGPVLPTDAEILAWVRADNPELLALSHEVLGREKAVELAGKSFYPDLTLGMNYIVTGDALNPGTLDSGKDPLMATISINVPIWRGSYRAAEEEAAARLRSAQESRSDREKALESIVSRVLYECRDAERKTNLYRDTLIPKGEQSLESAETGFMAGHIDFLDVIDAQRVLLEFELALDRAQATHAQRLAELEMYAGRAIPVGEVER